MTTVSRWGRTMIAIGALALLAPHAHADCRAKSPAHSVALMELYTSEGCDSCPPADRWLSALNSRGDSVVAIGLHVDYWDRLGWKDRFASARSEEHTSELQSHSDLVCRLLLEKKKIVQGDTVMRV